MSLCKPNRSEKFPFILKNLHQTFQFPVCTDAWWEKVACETFFYLWEITRDLVKSQSALGIINQSECLYASCAGQSPCMGGLGNWKIAPDIKRLLAEKYHIPLLTSEYMIATNDHKRKILTLNTQVQVLKDFEMTNQSVLSDITWCAWSACTISVIYNF